MRKTSNEEILVPGHVCTIRNPNVANGVLAALVALSLVAAVWLVSVMLAGPWFAETLAVEGGIAAVVVLAFAGSARLRALGCGRCGTPQAIAVDQDSR